MIRKIVLLTAFICLSLSSGCAQLTTKKKGILQANKISSKDSLLIDSLFVDFSKDRPGAAVMIAKDDNILYENGFGLIDLKNKKYINSDTKFFLASASKQFTAVAILQLIDKGKLKLETTLKDIFPDFPKYGKDITIQYLLTHQSGLKEINRIPGKQVTDNDRLRKLYETDSLLFFPGSKYEYSNTGYSILAEIVAKISKIPFDDYMQQYIFSPIKMTNTLYYGNSMQQNIGYKITKDSIIQAQGVRDATMGSGSVYTSINDYFKWHLALNNYNLISKELQIKSYSPQDGTKNRWGYYGYGWNVLKNNTYSFVEHGGISQSTGFICFTARIPEENITVAIFTNRAWSRENLASQNIGNRAKVLLHIATNGKFPSPEIIDPTPKKSLAQDFLDDLLSNNIESAKKLLENRKKSDIYYLDKNEFNKVGYYLVNNKRIEIAIEVFKITIELFPNSWNAYDSLAESYMLVNNIKLALEYYKKSVALNPKNLHAIKQIEELKQKQ